LKKTLENIQFLCEEKSYTFEEMQRFFGEFDKTQFITELKEKKYLEQDKNLERFRFKYVGIISYNNFTNCIFPKYYYNTDLDYNKAKILLEFKQIIKVFKKYIIDFLKLKSINKDLKGYDEEKINLEGSEFILADAIIKDYITSGLYIKEQIEYLINGEGETIWDATVNSITPFFTKGKPLYSDVISSNTFIEDDYIITQIHKWAVKYCIKRYGVLLDYDLSFDIESPDNLSEIGEDKMLINLLNRERNDVFVDRSVRLLNLLLSLVKKKYNDTYNDLTLFGTTSFEHIWQQTCAASFNNRLIETIKIENVISNLPSGSELLGKTFKDIIPQPKWWSKELNKTKEVSTLIPDIISVIDDFNKKPLNLNERLFFVLDPKYYNLEFCLGNNNEIIIKDNPSVGDITKQILYEHVYQDKLSEYFNKLYNILLFPKLNITNEYNQNTFCQVTGNVKFELEIFTENTVWLLWIDPIQIYDSYLKNNLKGEKELINIAKEIDFIT
jgi:hypothetical protein